MEHRPNENAVSVSMTFDVDAESALLGQGLEEETNYSRFSGRRFGIARGLSRILSLLDDHDIKGTFFVPGYTADRYPAAIAALAERGHEIAHHGYFHLSPNKLDEAGQREELERGTEALVKITGVAPVGYRSPSWEMTDDTFRMLGEMGFEYDSSCMGDDRPYVETFGSTSLLELPVHWSMDDVPYYSGPDVTGGPLSDPAMMSEVWLSEFRVALLEGGHVTYTAHPEVSGRRSRFEALKELVETISGTSNVWFATHHELARHVRASGNDQSSRGHGPLDASAS